MERTEPVRIEDAALAVRFNGDYVKSYYRLFDARSAAERERDTRERRLAGSLAIFFHGHARRPDDADQFMTEFARRSKSGIIVAVVCDTPFENLRLVPGTTGLLDVANPKYQQKLALIRELRQIEADLIIVDLDAGAHLNTLDFFLLTENNGILVITPEKTSIDNAFKFLRAALFRRIERFYQSPEVALLLKRNETLTDFLDAIQVSDVFEPEVREQVCGEMTALAQSLRPKIVVNKAHNAYEAQIAANILAKYARQYLRIEPSNLGFIYFDKLVSDSVNAGTPFVVSHPAQKVSACVADLANRLGYV